MVAELGRPIRHRPETVREQNLRLELIDARQELREVGGALPSAKALYRYVTVVADSPEAEQHAARVYWLIQRAHRRHVKGAA